METDAEECYMMVLERLGIDVNHISEDSKECIVDRDTKEVSPTNRHIASPAYDRQYQTVRKYFFTRPLGFDYENVKGVKLVVTAVISGSQAELMEVQISWEMVDINNATSIEEMVSLLENEELLDPLLVTFRVTV